MQFPLAFYARARKTLHHSTTTTSCTCALNNSLTTFIKIAVVILIVVGFLTFTREMPTANGAFIAEDLFLGIYWDRNCTSEVDLFDWGTQGPGSSETIIVFVRNNGYSTVHLSLNTTGWNPPEAIDHVSLDWNYTEKFISPNEVTPISFRLSISPNISGVTTFGFNTLVSTYECEGLSLSEIEQCLFHAPANSVYFVPTGNKYDDSTLYAVYAYKKNPQIITSPTQSSISSSYLNNDGKPLFTGNIITFGGRFANRMVRFYEDSGLAKIGFETNETHYIFKRISDNLHLYVIDSTTYNEKEKDYFVFQIYRDGDRYVLSEWGICAEGTYAGGVCFIDIIMPQLENYTNQFYIFSWTDYNADGMPQREEIALEATGI